ncbi:putative superfamily III holin-X [Nocardiopsis sp. Huas11]|uniref:phage holin family protein n=1 Tax=Nocardiopsis sp. Huas11 TaxID=2183912 RepID=UPI000EB12990|nr:phage holin family protein [Nocardiopsis sp. Huas11]RKS06415.1 putative superfamily III holin-X [Nocardiopsis sp. Huas11]
MVDKPGAGEPGATSGIDRSIGELVSDATDNLSRLVRLEIKLAKLEAKADAVKIGKGLGEFLAAGVILHLFMILLSVTIGLGLWEIFDLPLWGAFGIVTLFYLLIAAAFILTALINLRRRQGLARTAVTTTRLVEILRGGHRPPKGETSVDPAKTEQAPVSSDSV